jgi:hypothetical protein
VISGEKYAAYDAEDDVRHPSLNLYYPHREPNFAAYESADYASVTREVIPRTDGEQPSVRQVNSITLQ